MLPRAIHWLLNYIYIFDCEPSVVTGIDGAKYACMGYIYLHCMAKNACMHYNANTAVHARAQYVYTLFDVCMFN